MDPYLTALPDPRLMARLTAQLRTRDRVRAFEVGGEALAVAILGTRPGEPLPDWVAPLADAMVGALLLVEDATIDQAPAAQRLRLASSAIVLSTLRPRASAAVDGAVSMWVGWGTWPTAQLDKECSLLRATLLRLFLDDVDGAAEAVDLLLDRGAFGPGLVLHDWVVSRLQGHGPERHTMCFQHLRTALDADQRSPDLVIVAAVVLNHQLGPMRRGEVIPWLFRDNAERTRRAG